MAQEERIVPRAPAGPRPSARRPAVRPRAHDVPSQAQRSTGCSSRARPEEQVDVPVQLHPVAWVRALRAQGSQSHQLSEATKADRAKAHAVAALQRLFFEALRNGQDANGAAAEALRRLLGVHENLDHSKLYRQNWSKKYTLQCRYVMIGFGVSVELQIIKSKSVLYIEQD